MPHSEQTISAGTKSVAPVTGAATAGKLPVFILGISAPTISDSAFAQADSGHQVKVGVGAAVNAGQVAAAPCVVVGENASAWGDGAVAIGKSTIAGQTIDSTGAIAIGNGVVANKRNAIVIGSVFVANGTLEDTIAIGSQQTAGGGAQAQGAIAIGKTSLVQGVNGIAIGTGTTASEGSSIAIGNGASCGNSGLGTPNKNIAIGDGASALPVLGGASIAIGAGATTTKSNECVIGSNGNPINILTLNAGGAATTAGIRSAGTGGVSINNAANTINIFWIKDNGAMLRPSTGAGPVVGNAVLVAGTKAVASTAVTASTIVLLTLKTVGGTLGTAITYVLNAGVGFTINSNNALDTSTFSWQLVEAN